MGREFSDAVDGAGVQASGAVGLGLQPDADVFDWGGEDCVGEACEGAGGVILGVAQRGRGAREGVWRQGSGREGGMGRGVLGFEGTFGKVEGAELDRDAGAYADQGSESTFVEGWSALIAEDLGRAVEGAGVLGCGLQAYFYNVCMGQVGCEDDRW